MVSVALQHGSFSAYGTQPFKQQNEEITACLHSLQLQG